MKIQKNVHKALRDLLDNHDLNLSQKLDVLIYEASLLTARLRDEQKRRDAELKRPVPLATGRTSYTNVRSQVPRPDDDRFNYNGTETGRTQTKVPNIANKPRTR